MSERDPPVFSRKDRIAALKNAHDLYLRATGDAGPRGDLTCLALKEMIKEIEDGGDEVHRRCHAYPVQTHNHEI